jgi:peptidoglycan LD-endopeptidase CwlK
MNIIISRDKKLLYPPFAEQLRDFESRLTVVKLPFYLHMGLRTFEDQDTLYAQGRALPGKIVTNACGGDSLHNYGLAADYVLDGMPDKPGIQWSWQIRVDFNAGGRSDWMQMGEIAEICGLEWGGR